MAGTPVKTVFIDSSVLFSACKSRYGASAQILAYCKKEKIKGRISLYVIAEVKRNIAYETDQKVKQRLNMFLLSSKLKLVEPSETEKNKCEEIINQKDAPILASAISSQVDYLLTLNTKDFKGSELKTAVEQMKIMIPKDFIQTEKLG